MVLGPSVSCYLQRCVRVYLGSVNTSTFRLSVLMRFYRHYSWTDSFICSVAQKDCGRLCWCCIFHRRLWSFLGHVLHAVRLHDMPCAKSGHQCFEQYSLRAKSCIRLARISIMGTCSLCDICIGESVPEQTG